VRGGDRRRVEVGQGAGEPAPPLLDDLARALGEQFDDGVGIVGGHAGQGRTQAKLDADQALADPFPQLAGGHPREGDQQQPIEWGALGDVARRECRDRVRLAGPGAGLEHGHPGGEGPAYVEWLLVGVIGHPALSTSRVSSSLHTLRA